MVKTLLKHEANAYLHTLVPMNIVLLFIALLTRIIWIFESDTNAFDIIGGSSVAALVIAMIVSVVMSVAFSITRFYKNLFTSEGYLTMSLPASPAQHIFSKLICAVAFNLLTAVMIIAAIAVATFGELFVELVKTAFYILGRFIEEFTFNGVFWIIEGIVYAIVYLASLFLLYYACITVGQLAKKNRVRAAFGAFFAHFFICQILGTFALVILEPFLNFELWKAIARFMSDYPKTTVHIVIILMIIGNALLSVLYYFIAHRIMSRRLNLE